MESVNDAVARLEAAHEPYVHVTVVRRVRPSSANVGDRAVVTAGGEMIGFVGGHCTRSLVVEQARACLRAGESRLLLVTAHPPTDPGEGVLVLPMTCHSEGAVELFMEPKLQRPLLAVIGASPIALAICGLAPQFGFEAVQSALESNAADVRSAAPDGGIGDPIERLRKPLVGYRQRTTYGVVATMGLYDVDAVTALADRPLSYLGVVTSPRRWQVLRDELQSAGVPASLCDHAAAPAGLDIGASGPDEIALCILAQIVERRRRGGGTWEPLASGGAQSDEAAAATAVVAPDACGWQTLSRSEPARKDRVVDPVCGMTVDLTTTAYVTVYRGVTYGFCCAGCKGKFEANPDAYLSVRQVGRQSPN
ncbi:XdhC family protein [Alicyclobacillus sp. ALC3]|uniref:XdhC family protein n=1 Tax=Alicyclobacillus sp. ALC3 TaxID=2796143 RepID=UPI0023782871|nr:XdhC family protein [Alicyclobacillus sp. ALC3]WDL96272.1 XdhC family protein [Alicyclobacillus sp. ALC3]